MNNTAHQALIRFHVSKRGYFLGLFQYDQELTRADEVALEKQIRYHFERNKPSDVTDYTINMHQQNIYFSKNQKSFTLPPLETSINGETFTVNFEFTYLLHPTQEGNEEYKIRYGGGAKRHKTRRRRTSRRSRTCRHRV